MLWGIVAPQLSLVALIRFDDGVDRNVLTFAFQCFGYNVGGSRRPRVPSVL